MILAMVCFAFAYLIVAVLLKGGISNIATKRLYKSGTGWCFWRWTTVESEYILRLHVVKTPWCALCLHWIRKPDKEPWLHDHPVSFLSIILRGGYAELRQKPGEDKPRHIVHRWYNFVRASQGDRHRIVLCRPNTLTLAFMGPKTREWGFHVWTELEPLRWLFWKTYYARMKAGEAMRPSAGTFTFIPREHAGYTVVGDPREEPWMAESEWRRLAQDDLPATDEDQRSIDAAPPAPYNAADFADEEPTEPRR